MWLISCRGVMATGVGKVRRVVCASPAYLAQWGVPQTPQDLLDHQCLHFSHLTDGTNWHFQRGEGSSLEEDTALLAKYGDALKLPIRWMPDGENGRAADLSHIITAARHANKEEQP